MVDTAQHVQVLDYKMCERRLANAEGMLYCARAANGAFTIYWTDEPCFKPPVLSVGLGDQISGLLAPLGDAGCWRTIQPTAAGWLYSDGISFFLAELPADAGIPDPLQINELIVNETATIKNLVIGETLCFDDLPEGTVENKVGLDENGCLVKGEAPSGISMAEYYESSDLLSDTQPNANKTDGESAEIGHEIYDPDDIAGVLSGTVIRIKKKGSYRIDWLGHFYAATADGYNVSLNLKINTSLVARGCGRSQPVAQVTSGSGPPRSARIHGIHLVDLDVDDNIELRVGKSSGGSARLEDVKLTLELFRPD